MLRTRRVPANETVLPSIMTKSRRAEPIFSYSVLESVYRDTQFKQIDESCPLHMYQIMRMQTVLGNVARSVRQHRNMSYFLTEHVWAGWCLLEDEKDFNPDCVKAFPVRPAHAGMDNYLDLSNYYLVVVQCLSLNYGNVPPTFQAFLAKLDVAHLHSESDELIVIDYRLVPGTQRHLFGQRCNSQVRDFHSEENVYAFMAFAGVRMLVNSVNSHWSFVWQPVPDVYAQSTRQTDDGEYLEAVASLDRFPCLDRMLYRSDSVHVTGDFIHVPTLLPWLIVRTSREYSGTHVFGILNDGYVFRILW